MMPLQKEDIALKRLISLQIAAPKFERPEQVVSWMGAMQAQDYEMSKWAVGLRMNAKTTDLDIEKAMDEGRIIRTHVLRPTWHLVAPEDLPWMLELTAPHVKKLSNYMNRQLGLDDAVFSRCRKIIEKALQQHNHMTRDEIMVLLNNAGIATGDIRSAHIMHDAELCGLVCSGPRKGKQLTYTLLEKRITSPTKLNREESLAELAKRYFTSHGPATLKDFVWWSDLGINDAKKALAFNDHILTKAVMEEKEYWFQEASVAGKVGEESVFVLPAFDEFLVGYTDRTDTLALEISKECISVNGIFKATIVLGGQVVGIWKRTIKPKQVSVELKLLYPLGSDIVEIIKLGLKPYGEYLGKEVLWV